MPDSLLELWKSGSYRIPQSGELVAGLIAEMERAGEMDKEKLKDQFGHLVEDMQKRVYHRYLELESQTASRLLKDYFSAFAGEGAGAVVDAVASHFREIDVFCLSLTQSRRTRAGKAFEDILKGLFSRMKYPFEEKPVINGVPDFILPSEAHYRRNAMDCIIFTSKRTLRERWRQIVTEGTRGLGFYLATIDEKVSAKALEEMRAHRIYIVVPERIKQAFYPDAVNAITFSNFFHDHLDPKMNSWRRAHVI